MSRPVKWRRVLAVLVQGEKLDKFQAERMGDHSLSATISRIQEHGISVSRRLKAVTGWQGQQTYVTQYWLDPDQVGKASQLLSGGA